MSTPCPDTRNGTRAEFRAAAATEHKQTTQVPVGLKRRGHRRGGTEGRHTGQRYVCIGQRYRMTRMLPPWHAACIGVSRRLAEHCCTSAPPTSTSSRTCMPCVRPRTRVPVCACVRKYTSRHGHAHVHRHVATCMDPRIAHTRARARAHKLVSAGRASRTSSKSPLRAASISAENSSPDRAAFASARPNLRQVPARCGG